VLILRDVLAWPAPEVAELLDRYIAAFQDADVVALERLLRHWRLTVADGAIARITAFGDPALVSVFGFSAVPLTGADSQPT
jgi:hypothetical protein